MRSVPWPLGSLRECCEPRKVKISTGPKRCTFPNSGTVSVDAGRDFRALEFVEAEVHAAQVKLMHWLERGLLRLGPALVNLHGDVPVERSHDRRALIAEFPPRRIGLERSSDLIKRHCVRKRHRRRSARDDGDDE
jgi:hypothetical protein